MFTVIISIIIIIATVTITTISFTITTITIITIMTDSAAWALHSAKGGAVETGCSGLHDVTGCFTI